MTQFVLSGAARVFLAVPNSAIDSSYPHHAIQSEGQDHEKEKEGPEVRHGKCPGNGLGIRNKSKSWSW